MSSFVSLRKKTIYIFSTLIILNNKCCTPKNKKDRINQEIFNIEKNQNNLTREQICLDNINEISTNDILNNSKTTENITQNMTSLYFDIVTNDSEGGQQNKIKAIDTSINGIIENIKTKLLNILKLKDESKYTNFNTSLENHVNKIFEKISIFKNNIITTEGPKDIILLFFFFKKIEILFSNINTANSFSIENFSNLLNIDDISIEFNNKIYEIKKNNKSIVFHPSYHDETLVINLSNILSHIKACFFIYAIYIADIIHDLFPMLFNNKMKLKAIKSETDLLFYGKNNNRSASSFFYILEEKNNNRNIAYLYRMILSSNLADIKNIYTILFSNKYKSGNELFTQNLAGNFNYAISLNNENCSKYTDIYTKISNNKTLKNNKIGKQILEIYNKKIQETGKKTTTLIKYLENSSNPAINSLIFTEHNTKYININCAEVFYLDKASLSEDILKFLN